MGLVGECLCTWGGACLCLTCVLEWQVSHGRHSTLNHRKQKYNLLNLLLMIIFDNHKQPTTWIFMYLAWACVPPIIYNYSPSGVAGSNCHGDSISGKNQRFCQALMLRTLHATKNLQPTISYGNKSNESVVCCIFNELLSLAKSQWD